MNRGMQVLFLAKVGECTLMPSARMARAHMARDFLTICFKFAITSAGTPLPAQDSALLTAVHAPACAA